MNTTKTDSIEMNNKTAPNLIHNFERDGSKKSKKVPLILGALIAFGLFSGYLLNRFLPLSNTNGKMSSIDEVTTNGKAAVGSTDTKTFSDMAEGTLEEGSLNGEGTHKLIRPGGESQTVYLISTVLNLDDFVGKKIRVWGETNAAQSAGWLMDVGRVELLSE